MPAAALPLSVLIACLTLFSACEKNPFSSPAPQKPSNETPREVKKPDAPRTGPLPMASTTEPGSVGTLFDKAADCPNRYKCEALDDLYKMIEGPRGREVVTAAFDLIAGGKIREQDRQGKFACQVIREWLLFLKNGNALDAQTGTWCMAQIRRALKTGDAGFTGSLQLLALNAGLEGAIDWVEEDVTGPGRTTGKACAAGRFLSGYLKDFDHARRWLKNAGENGLAAAICSLHHFDHDFFDVERDELPLLRKAAGVPKLAGEIAWPLLDHVEIHRQDERFRAIAGMLRTHPDEQIRKQAALLSTPEK
ncbi:MAG: hypothetical protein CVU59_07130 [Deltaproteobacteria bacterium HGW-Deltaproteobacteria-17]|nr:MAG: hypothetical protein CVU59_07130 [Deltaproteobacteria bacterium HGW-Deltaproteobacteria-17]